eukprot:113761-Alexandrium_andersonii.AAC.1
MRQWDNDRPLPVGTPRPGEKAVGGSNRTGQSVEVLNQLLCQSCSTASGDLDRALDDDGWFALLLASSATGLNAVEGEPQACDRCDHGRVKVFENALQFPRLGVVAEHPEDMEPR